jgi:fimbrial chaperone protein
MTRFIAFAATAATLLGALMVPAPAAAATFSVNPTQIFLAHRSASSLLSLRNDSDQTLRFELSVFAWTQNTNGEMTLEPTKDIIFFPSLLTLAPSEERKVRVGRVAPAGAREKTYRIFVKELPSVDQANGAGVRVLTTMGIPIFVRPEKETASAELSGLQHANGTLQFVLANTGTVHFVPQVIKVQGLKSGVEAFETSVDGWYVLAAGRREFAVNLPPESCAGVDALLIHVQFASATLEERLQTPGGTCER